MKRLKDPKQVYNGLDSIAIEALRNTGIFAMRVTQKLQFPIGDNYTNNNCSNSIDFTQSLSTPMGNDGTFSCLSDDWSDTYSVDNDGIYLFIYIIVPHFFNEKTRVNSFTTIPPQIIDHHHNISAYRIEQRGVVRSNCIDCLDRTNVAQVYL